MRADCPEPERLAAFAMGTLSPEDRDEVIAHLADCDACAEVVADSAAWLDEEAVGTSDPVAFPSAESENEVEAAEHEAQTVAGSDRRFDRIAWRMAAGVAGAVLATTALLLVFGSEPAVDLVASNQPPATASSVVAVLGVGVLENFVTPDWSSSARSGSDSSSKKLRSFETGRSQFWSEFEKSRRQRLGLAEEGDVAPTTLAGLIPNYVAFGAWVEAQWLRCETGSTKPNDELVAEARGWIELLDRDGIKSLLAEFAAAIEDDRPVCGDKGALDTLRKNAADGIAPDLPG